MQKYLFVWIFLVLCVANNTKHYRKVIHNTDPEAKCLDGSPSLLYVNQGGDTKHIMIYFLGGGDCGADSKQQVLESCYQRSKDFLGSSRPWPEILHQNDVQGYLSTDPNVSPFVNWTKFYFAYCDGSSHQGYTKNPIKYKDASLHFRGSLITRAHIDWIQSNYNLRGASKIILTGMSAGGMAVNTWSNYVKDFVGDDSKVYPISDSGIFLDFQTQSGKWEMAIQARNLVAVANMDELTPIKGCNQKYPGQQWKCTYIEYVYPFLRGRYMIVNSQYDAWVIPYELQIDCLKDGVSGQTLTGCSKKQMEYIQKYRSAYKELLKKWSTVNNELSIWSIACSQHVYAAYKYFYDSPHQKIPALTGKTVKDAINMYVLEDKRVILEYQDGWPSNTGCAK